MEEKEEEENITYQGDARNLEPFRGKRNITDENFLVPSYQTCH